MKRVMLALAVVVCLPAWGFAKDDPSSEFPLPGCGSTLGKSNNSHQLGTFVWLQYVVESFVDPNLCVYIVTVDAFVQGVPGSALSRLGAFTATARREVPVPDYGRWTTIGFHTSATIVPGLRLTGVTLSEADVRAPAFFDPVVFPEPVECDGEWDPETGHCVRVNCPIVINLDRGAYRLTSIRDGVVFDLNANGSLERVAWTRGDADVAFLALDRNGNGRIDDGSELFGNHTPVWANRPDATAPNGFEALRFTQGMSYGYGTQDEQIDWRDPVWQKLLLWTDRNHNGISEPDELMRVADSGLAAISLDYKTTKRVDQFGNEFRQRGEVMWQDGEATKIFDVWLQTAPRR
jgi:hypothetical protein